MPTVWYKLVPYRVKLKVSVVDPDPEIIISDPDPASITKMT